MTHSFPTRRSSDLPDAGRGGGEQHLALRSRRAARRARGPSHGGARMNGLFLIAEIGGRAVAISADQIESVVDIGVVTPIPLADARVRGLAALRSRVVTVIDRSEEHTSELQSLMRISYAVFCLNKKKDKA